MMISKFSLTTIFIQKIHWFIYTAKCPDTYALYLFDILQIHCVVRHFLGWNQYPSLKPFCIYGLSKFVYFFIAVIFFSTYTSLCCALGISKGSYIAMQQFSITTELFIVFMKHLSTSLLQNEGSAEL